jgi:methionyl-tRNA formyltransferase
MNVILCGYNWSGCKALSFLIKRRYNIYVYTTKSPFFLADLEQMCIDMKIPHSLEKIEYNNLPFKPDIICSIYYPFIIGLDIIKYTNYKIFNLHPSLLPRYKGCSSLTWAMINGESEIGYTYHYINEKVDEGNIILQKKMNIESWDLQSTIYNRVMFEALCDFETVFDLVLISYPGFNQTLGGEYYKRGCPYNGEIDDSWDESMVKRFIRAMIYPPLLPAKYKDTQILKFQDYLYIKNKKED